MAENLLEIRDLLIEAEIDGIWKPIVNGLSLNLQKGEIVGLIGESGAGKSTLLAALAGDLDLDAGTVRLGEREVRSMRSLDLARRRAVLPQQGRLAFGFLVREVVAMGRAPWARTGHEDDDDRLVEQALQRADVVHLTERSYPTLSGGERARTDLARVLAQDTAVVLLDEIEKAHPDLFNILLQVFEDGQLTDGLGNRVNFKNTIIIMTSNIGARFIQKKASLGFQPSDAREIQRNVTDMVLAEVKRTFNPEFVNRVDEIIVFEALLDDDLRQITVMLIDQLNEHLVDRKLQITLTPEVVDWVINMTCKDRSYGARPLRRAIQRYVEDLLSEELICGRLSSGTIEVYLDGGELAYRDAGRTYAGRRLAVSV